MSVTLSLDEVYDLTLRALTGSNTSDTNARPVADSIRAAEADGLHNAGLGHLPQQVDILAAGVTGSSFTFEASSSAHTLGNPPDLGQFLIAIDPAAFGGIDFETRLETLLSAMLCQEGVRLPGDRRIAKRLAAQKAGISISDELYQRLLGYC